MTLSRRFTLSRFVDLYRPQAPKTDADTFRLIALFNLAQPVHFLHKLGVVSIFHFFTYWVFWQKIGVDLFLVNRGTILGP